MLSPELLPQLPPHLPPQLLAQLPALQVVIPLMAAPASLILYRPRLVWGFATLISWIALAMGVALLQETLQHGIVSYDMGGWAAPWGIEYRIDPVNAFVLVIVAAMSAVVLLFARTSVEREVARARVPLFYTAWLLCLAGLLGITITGDVFNLFVFLEISSLASYALISMSEDRRALTAAFQYLVLGTIGATFILIGIGLLYVMTGTLNMNDLAVRLPPVLDTRTVEAAFAFLTIGIGIKMALFPLHLWLPNAYAYAPSAVTAFLASSATKVAVYVLLRFFFTVFGTWLSFDVMRLHAVLVPLALLGIFAASTVAIYQRDIKRMLGYSSVAQIGYMILGIGLVSLGGLTASILHLFNHALMKSALFMALGCVFYRTGSVRLDDLAGIARHMPWTMAAFVAAGLSLIGVPLTAGFISKWYFVVAVLEQNAWWLAGLIVASSLIALVYIWRVVEVAYFREPGEALAGVREAPLALLVPTWLMVAANVYFGIEAGVSTGIARRAAHMLLGTGG